MSTIKRRINISVSKEVDHALRRIAVREHVPQATIASNLLKIALEIEEDVALDALARHRDADGAKYLSHEKAWGPAA